MQTGKIEKRQDCALPCLDLEQAARLRILQMKMQQQRRRQAEPYRNNDNRECLQTCGWFRVIDLRVQGKQRATIK